MTSHSATAREYLRVSTDRSGRVRSHDEQHADNQSAIERQGWTLLEEAYRDVGSASRYSRATREEFDRLVADMRAKRFGADYLVLWESSRGSRRVGEWVELIDLAAARGVSFFITTHGRSYDPANSRDRRSLLEDAVDSEYESSKVSERALRATASNAAAGRPHGRVPFGYRRVYDSVTRAYAGQEPVPDEAALVRELFERVLAGHSFRSIAADWADRGVMAPCGGRPFTQQRLRAMMLRPVYAGLRSHTPGRQSGDAAPTEATTYTHGDWEPIVDEATWRTARDKITDPRRTTVVDGRAKHLLTGIGVCDVCERPISVKANNGRGYQYRCHHFLIDRDELDSLVEEIILGYLARDDVFAQLTHADADQTEKLASLDREISDVERQINELADEVGSGRMSPAMGSRAEASLRTRQGELSTQRAELTAPSALRGFVGPDADVRARWGVAPLETRREVARVVLTPDHIGQLRIQRAGRGYRVPVHTRVRFARY